MSEQPVSRISPADLDILMSTLEVQFLMLSKCLVSKGYALQLGKTPAPGIHYNLSGHGFLLVGDHPPIELKEHTLVIIPCKQNVRIVAGLQDEQTTQPVIIDADAQETRITNGVYNFAAGNDEPEIVLICGYFHAHYGSTNLFSTLYAPIIEQFSESDRLDKVLKAALDELTSDEIGAGAMSGALLKQVIVPLLRRSLTSINLWVERFSMLRDPQIAQAFSIMVADPGGPHNTKSLARAATLSRSSFMSRFTEIVGKPPMVVLRDLRMRLAAKQLRAGILSVDQIAQNVGYESRSSFVRVFQDTFDCGPTDYRSSPQI